MKKGTLYISCGIPGSGKTTFLNKIKKENEIIVSRDDIRFSLLKEGEEYFSHEKEVFNNFTTTITEYINSGYNVYADATHLNKISRDKLLNALTLKKCSPSSIEAIFFDIPLETCLERNEKRKGTKTYVPRGIIRRMFSSLEEPVEFSTYWSIDENENISKWITGG